MDKALLKAEDFKVSPNTVSRLAKRGTIQAKGGPVDTRVRLVDLDELRRLFAYRRSEITDDEDDE